MIKSGKLERPGTTDSGCARRSGRRRLSLEMVIRGRSRERRNCRNYACPGRPGRVSCASVIERLIGRSDDRLGGTSSTPAAQSSISLVWEHVAFPRLGLRIDPLPHQRRSSTRPIALLSRPASADRCHLTSFPVSALPSRAMVLHGLGGDRVRSGRSRYERSPIPGRP